MPAGQLETVRDESESTLLRSLAHTRPSVEQAQPRFRRSAKWGLEDNIAYYGQEKKLSVNIEICLVSLHPSVSVRPSLTPQKLQLLFKNKV